MEELLENYQSYTGQLTARHVDTNPEPSDGQQPTSKLCTGNNYEDLMQNEVGRGCLDRDEYLLAKWQRGKGLDIWGSAPDPLAMKPPGYPDCLAFALQFG